MGRFVIAAFKPKPGMHQKLGALVEKHWRILREEGLVTDRPRHAMKAVNGTIVEVFEWRDEQAVKQAHQNTAVLALWAEFEEACDYVPVAGLPEAQHPFSEFEALGA